MFGLEKKPKNMFEFDLEKDVRGSAKKAKEITDKLDSAISKIKEELRSGAKSEDYDKLGILLHGYVAMKTVIARIQRTK